MNVRCFAVPGATRARIWAGSGIAVSLSETFRIAKPGRQFSQKAHFGVEFTHFIKMIAFGPRWSLLGGKLHLGAKTHFRGEMGAKIINKR